MTTAAVDEGQQRRQQQRQKEGGGWVGQGCCVFVCGKSAWEQLLCKRHSGAIVFALPEHFFHSQRRKVLRNAFLSSDKNAP